MIAVGCKIKRRANVDKPRAAIGVVIGLYTRTSKRGETSERARVDWPGAPEGDHAAESLVVVDAEGRAVVAPDVAAEAAEDNAAILAPPAFVGTPDELEGWLAAAGAPEAVDPILAALTHDDGGRNPRTEWRGDPGLPLERPTPGLVVTPRMLEAAHAILAAPLGDVDAVKAWAAWGERNLDHREGAYDDVRGVGQRCQAFECADPDCYSCRSHDCARCGAAQGEHAAPAPEAPGGAERAAEGKPCPSVGKGKGANGDPRAPWDGGSSAGEWRSMIGETHGANGSRDLVDPHGLRVDAPAPARVLVTLRWTERDGRKERQRQQVRLGTVVERGPDVVIVDVPGYGVVRCWPSDVEDATR